MTCPAIFNVVCLRCPGAHRGRPRGAQSGGATSLGPAAASSSAFRRDQRLFGAVDTRVGHFRSLTTHISWRRYLRTLISPKSMCACMGWRSAMPSDGQAARSHAVAAVSRSEAPKADGGCNRVVGRRLCGERSLSRWRWPSARLSEPGSAQGSWREQPQGRSRPAQQVRPADRPGVRQVEDRLDERQSIGNNRPARRRMRAPFMGPAAAADSTRMPRPNRGLGSHR